MSKEKEAAPRIGISALTIKIGKREIEITPEDAKDLYMALDKLYGEKVRVERHTEYVPYSRPYWWYQPTYLGYSCGNVSLNAQPNQDFTSLLNSTTEKTSFSTAIDYQALASSALKL